MIDLTSRLNIVSSPLAWYSYLLMAVNLADTYEEQEY